MSYQPIGSSPAAPLFRSSTGYVPSGCLNNFAKGTITVPDSGGRDSSRRSQFAFYDAYEARIASELRLLCGGDVSPDQHSVIGIHPRTNIIRSIRNSDPHQCSRPSRGGGTTT